MKENILILVNSFISCSKNQYFKTQLINTEHRTQNTDTEHRTQTHVKNVLLLGRNTVYFITRGYQLDTALSFSSWQLNFHLNFYDLFCKSADQKQVCIPVGCIPPACCPFPVVSGGGGAVCLGGVCLGGCLPGGVCPGRCVFQYAIGQTPIHCEQND